MPKIADEVRATRRQRILDAAWHCAKTQGFATLTVDDVCAQAGYSKGSFYGYFASKTALLIALLEDDSARLDDIMAEIERRHARSVDRIRAFAREMVSRGSDAATVRVSTDLWVALLADKTVSDRFAGLSAERRKRLRRWVDEAIDGGELVDVPANALAAVLMALGDGLMLHNAVSPSSFRWTNVTKVLDALLGGLTAQSE